MRMLMHNLARRLQVGLAAAACSVICASVWAQSGPNSTPAPKPASVSPPPADLEPGVNTSATPSSSDDSKPPAAPKSDSVDAKAVSPRRKSQGAGAGSSSPSTNATPQPANTDSAGASSGADAGSATSAKSGTTAKAGTAGAVPKSGAGAGKAHDRIELDTTDITGNRELPKVLYIVPWKRSDLGDLVGKPVNSLVDEVLAPVDRDVFKRQNRYYDALKPDGAAQASGAAPK